jgi:hypothetical protein
MKPLLLKMAVAGALWFFFWVTGIFFHQTSIILTITCWRYAIMMFRNDNVEVQEYMQQAKKAKSDWEAAQNFFNNVSDPDLIDFAIYDLEASRRKYLYLMKKIRIQMTQTQEIINP